MLAEIPGFVSQVNDPYTDKATGQEVRTMQVACGDLMLRVRLGEEDDFEAMDRVIIMGNLRVWDGRLQCTTVGVRSATASDEDRYRTGRRLARAQEEAAIAGHKIPGAAVVSEPKEGSK